MKSKQQLIKEANALLDKVEDILHSIVATRKDFEAKLAERKAQNEI